MFAFTTTSPDGRKAYRIPGAILEPIGKGNPLVRVRRHPEGVNYAISRNAAASILRVARWGVDPFA